MLLALETDGGDFSCALTSSLSHKQALLYIYTAISYLEFPKISNLFCIGI